MNKKTMVRNVVLLGLSILTAPAFAQKTEVVGKNQQPPRQPTAPENNTYVPPPPPMVPIPATNVGSPNTNTATPATPVGVQGTSTTPTNLGGDPKLGNTSQVGGINQGAQNTDVKGAGKKVAAPLKDPNPSKQTNVPVPAVGGEQTSEYTGAGPVTPPLNNGTEIHGLVGSSAFKPNATTSTTTLEPTVNGAQTTKQDVVEQKSCEDEALQKINQIILRDNSNVLGKMFELTTMRLAKKALAEGNITLEGYTRNKIADLEKQMNAVKSSAEIQSQVKAVYETYGKKADLESINKDIDEALTKGKKACYWSVNTRLANDQTSAFVLAASASDKNSGLTDADAATIWTVEKIRKAAAGSDPSYRFGQANGSLMNVSNRVARYLGAIQGGKSSSKQDLDKMIADQEQELLQMMGKAYAQVKVSLTKCIEVQKNCSNCAVKATEDFEQSNFGLDQIQRSLMQTIAKTENAQMTGKIKGKLGEIDFDFNKTLARGTVAQVPERMNKFDACGQPRTPASAGGSTGSTSGSGKLAQDASCTKNEANCVPGAKKEKIYSGGTLPTFTVVGHKNGSTANKDVKMPVDKTYVAPYSSVKEIAPIQKNSLK